MRNLNHVIFGVVRLSNVSREVTPFRVSWENRRAIIRGYQQGNLCN